VASVADTAVLVATAAIPIGGIGVNLLNIILQPHQFNEAATAYGARAAALMVCLPLIAASAN
jgi:uncharacterized membrane protein YdjX (TVP38/TMEM64 family)